MKHKILLVEDEADLGNVVKQYLELMDFDVDWQQNGRTALDLFEKSPNAYHILLIDVNLPGLNGFELAEQIIRLNNHVPFLFLTARGDKNDRLSGLKIGADDYVVKPFDVDELVLRIRNIIKRKQPVVSAEPAQQSVINIGTTHLFVDSLKLVTEQGEEIILTPRECDLLVLFFNNVNRVLKREEILTKVWGSNDYFVGRSLDVFISRFRKYFQHNINISIKNVYGIGFVFNVK
ncbi:MAG: two component transcriptional regulator, winged helix family [Bacteroidetes bacterium]|uniref:response regulator transcription factor n=1 Tax=Chitinophaga TaxID=79328 RepID=UPI0009CCD700|nr:MULTISPECIES: response regulator transcription factor [Chitinophaga]MBP1653166.1 two component transcriptional regulator, winged helix family [Bacteroidota bacterium]OMP79527.1 two-component system response regulator [[Flexibacter] sp. ATCC 35208]WPQ63873.1 response regulator transcription factor [Chitinophaga sancti]WPV68317.1 response regulator transcription factor [Chitinophaga sp. LS1]